MAFITALGNDLSFDDIFSEQIKNFGKRGDLLISISGSGNSKNIVRAVEVANIIGMYTVGLLGFNGGMLVDMVDLPLICKSDNYGIIESAHSFIHHYLVESLKIKK
jgi:D-sedoheptulose 7-phosphate isomerase